MNLQALATRLDVSTKTVASWVRKGCPHTRDTHGRYRFDLKAVQRWREQTLAPRPSTGPSSYHEARARKEAALAELRELQLRVRKGELVTRASVEKIMFDRARRARDRMENIPPRTSGLLAAETSQEKIFAILRRKFVKRWRTLDDDTIKDAWRPTLCPPAAEGSGSATSAPVDSRMCAKAVSPDGSRPAPRRSPRLVV